MQRRTFLKVGFLSIGAVAVQNSAYALKYYPKASNKKCAVVYSTWCGSSRDAAVWISEGMGGIADVFDVRENPDLTSFDHIVIGGSIRQMETSQELQAYIRVHKEELSKKVRGLFVVCGNMQRPVGPSEKERFIDKHLAVLCAVQNVPSRVFLGRITKCLLEPEAAKLLVNFEDYDNLKRSECLAFGKEIVQTLP
jgi:menaquinone-dependent protoporphyrinogen IX oxidase